MASSDSDEGDDVVMLDVDEASMMSETKPTDDLVVPISRLFLCILPPTDDTPMATLSVLEGGDAEMPDVADASMMSVTEPMVDLVVPISRLSLCFPTDVLVP